MRCLLVLFVACALGPAAPAQPEKKSDAKLDNKPFVVLNADGHTGRIVATFFTPDSKQLISVGEDKTIRTWDVASGEAIKVLRLPLGAEERIGSNPGMAAAISADAKTLAVACPAPVAKEHWIYLIDRASENVIRTIRAGDAAAWAAAMTADGKLVATGGASGSIQVWETETGSLKYTLKGHKGRISSLAFSQDGKALASGCLQHELRLWTMADGTLQKLLDAETHTGPVLGIAWRPDGKLLASAAAGEVKFWTAEGTLRDSHQYKAALGGSRVGFSRDGTELLVGATVVGTLKGRVRTRCVDFDDDDDSPKEPKKSDDAPARAAAGERARTAAISPDGKVAAWGGVDKLVLWNAGGMGQVKALVQLGGKGRSLGDTYWSTEGTTIGWDYRDGKQAGRSFDFSTLQLGTALEKAAGKELHELGPLALRKPSPNQLEFLRDGQQESVFNAGVEIHSYSFIGESYVVIGTGFGLRLINRKTGKPVRAYHGVGGVRVIAPMPGDKPSLFLSTGLDRVVRIWTLDRDHPLMSLFVSGNDWIVWAPEGYYASSLGGERLIGWQVNNGLDQLATFHAASEFRASLNRPDVMKLLLREKNLKTAVDLADKAKAVPADPPQVEALLPPKARIVIPARAATIVDPRITIRARGESSGKHPITRLQLLLDGRPYPGTVGVAAIASGSPKEVERDFNIVIPPGVHRLAVRAESTVSQAASAEVEVTFVAKSPEKEEPRLHVLSIGIDAYQPGGPQPLKCAAKDATELAAALSAGGKGLFGDVSVALLTDKTATRMGILKKLGELKNAMSHQDTAVIFFAGHGQPSGGKFYLLPQDVDPDHFETTAVSGTAVKEALRGMPGRVLLILDACHSALIGIDGLVGGLKEEAGVVVMISAQGSEKSLENRTIGHGYFTQALIEGLHGAADYNKDGYVYLSELVLYVETEVDRLSEGRQRPAVGKPPTIPSFPLAKVVANPR